MGLVSGIKGPLSEGIKILYHEALPCRMMNIRLDVTYVQSDTRSPISLSLLLIYALCQLRMGLVSGIKGSLR